MSEPDIEYIREMQPRVFTLEDQVAFARLSGDWNPIHVDPIYARRCLGGQIVVHGVHALLWLLESWLAGHAKPIAIHTLKVSFVRPIPLGAPVNWVVKAEQPSRTTLELFCGKSLVTRLEVEWGAVGRLTPSIVEAGLPEKRQPRDMSAENIEKASGKLNLHFDEECATELFPGLVKFLPASEFAVLLSTSRLVGVECPGLHSLFSEMHLASSRDFTTAGLDYEVTQVDRRFNLVIIQLKAPGLVGSIKAFARPRPQRQTDYATLQTCVERSEFANQRALIVGGSRGLGELVAKMLAAGGADVKITYFQGQEDAARVVEEIQLNGGGADSFRLNVLDETCQALQALENWRPSHLYYFATPFIFSGRKGQFSAELFNKFCAYYVTGFARMLEVLKHSEVRHIFYPSTVAIDELPLDMGEYTAAKVAGETLCAIIEKSQRGMTIFRPRLPRLATDQTASLLPVNNQDPSPIMLDLLRSFRDQSGMLPAAIHG